MWENLDWTKLKERWIWSLHSCCKIAFNCGLIEILVPTYYLGKPLIVEKCHGSRSVEVVYRRVTMVKMIFFLCLLRFKGMRLDDENFSRLVRKGKNLLHKRNFPVHRKSREFWNKFLWKCRYLYIFGTEMCSRFEYLTDQI